MGFVHCSTLASPRLGSVNIAQNHSLLHARPLNNFHHGWPTRLHPLCGYFMGKSQTCGSCGCGQKVTDPWPMSFWVQDLRENRRPATEFHVLNGQNHAMAHFPAWIEHVTAHLLGPLLDLLLREMILDRKAYEIISNTTDKDKQITAILDGLTEETFPKLLTCLRANSTNTKLQFLYQILQKHFDAQQQGGALWRVDAPCCHDILPEIHMDLCIIPKELTEFVQQNLHTVSMDKFEDQLQPILIVEYGLLINNISDRLKLTAQVLETADQAKLLTDIHDGKFAALISKHLKQGSEDVILSIRLQNTSVRLLQHKKCNSSTDAPSLPVARRVRGSLTILDEPWRLQVLWNMLSKVIIEKQPLTKFYNLLMKYRQDPDILNLRSDTGLPLMHEVISKKRIDLLVAFLYSGLWVDSYNSQVTSKINPKIASKISPKVSPEVISSISVYEGYNALKFAKALSNIDTVHELERLNQLHTMIERNPVKKACLRGDVKRFKELLKRNIKEVTKVTEKVACLDLAIGSTSLEIVNAVCNAEKRVKFHRANYDSQLLLCVELSQNKMIELLQVQCSGTLNANIAGPAGKTLMEYAAILGDVDTFKALHNIGGTIPITALCLVAASGATNMVEAFLTTYLSFMDLSYEDRHHKTSLQFAIEKGHVMIVKQLIAVETNITHLDKHGRNVLQSAAASGNIEILKLIIKWLRENEDLQRALSQADRLLGSEQCFAVRGKSDGKSAWHYIKVDRALLHDFKNSLHRGSLDVSDYGEMLGSGWGNNPSEEKVQEMESLFDSINLTSSAPQDMTPLHIAIMKDQAVAALYLVDLMQDINIADHYGLTPLHMACMRGNLEVVKALEARGARWDVEDAKGRTPGEVANLNHHKHLLQHVQTGSITNVTQSFIHLAISPLAKKLSKVELEKRCEAGQSVTDYVKETLKDLTGDVNIFLYDHIGAGPIAAET